MQTSDLIENLTTDLSPVSRHARSARVALALAGGMVIALAVLSLTLGLRGDLGEALFAMTFWRKGLFALGALAGALALCLRLARPEGAPGALPGILAAPFLILGALALFEIQSAPSGARMELWLGRSALVCPWLIGGLAIPAFVGILWALRQFAPTRPRLAGFSAGCLAGAGAAVVYAMHCQEYAASFVATWYSAGILLPGVVGLVIGPRVLRW
jgi:hypothetical protein